MADKWGGIAELADTCAAMSTGSHGNPTRAIEAELRRRIEPLLDAADHKLFAVETKTHVSLCPCAMRTLRRELATWKR